MKSEFHASAMVALALAFCVFTTAEAQSSFVRGDSNLDETVDISDGVATLGYLFLGGPALNCIDAAAMRSSIWPSTEVHVMESNRDGV